MHSGVVNKAEAYAFSALPQAYSNRPSACFQSISPFPGHISKICVVYATSHSYAQNSPEKSLPRNAAPKSLLLHCTAQEAD